MMAEEINTLRVRVKASDTPGGEYVTLEAEIKIPKINEEEEHQAFIRRDRQNDSICYEMYRQMKEIAKEVGFGDATGRSDASEEWKTVNKYTKAGQEVRWDMAGTRVRRFAADKEARHEERRQEDKEKKAMQPRKRDGDGLDKGVEEIEKELTFLYIQKRNRNTGRRNPRKERIGNQRSDERSDGGTGDPDVKQRIEAPEERKVQHPSEHTRLEEKWIKGTDAGGEKMEEMKARMEAAKRSDRGTPTPEQERNLPKYASWSYRQGRRKVKKRSVGPHTFHDSEKEKGQRPEQ